MLISSWSWDGSLFRSSWMRMQWDLICLILILIRHPVGICVICALWKWYSRIKLLMSGVAQVVVDYAAIFSFSWKYLSLCSNTNFTHQSLLTGLVEYYCMLNKLYIKSFVAPEGAAQSLINCHEWCKRWKKNIWRCGVTKKWVTRPLWPAPHFCKRLVAPGYLPLWT